MEVNEHLQANRPPAFRVVPETTLRLDETAFLEPDFCVFPRSIMPGDMRGHDVLLAIEIADTSLRYDLGRKIGVYAAYGIAEVWVIDANTLVTHIHRSLGAEGYRVRREAGPDEDISAGRAEGVSLCLSTLGLKPL
jgi:Uma2 family endonuclease